MSMKKKGTIASNMHTLKSLERFEHLDELDGPQDIGVFRRDLDDNLQILTNVDPEHLLQAGHRLFSSKTTEVVNQPL